VTSEELAAIRARVEAATPGPWHNAGYPLKGIDGPEVMAAGDAHLLTMVCRPSDNEDATFIAHARQDVPVLLDEVARLAAEVERLTTALEAGRTKRRAADAVLSAVAGWVYVGGAAFKPPPGAADSFGDGMRAAKNQIADILRRHLNPTSWSVP
jgi:hypothetical protein